MFANIAKALKTFGAWAEKEWIKIYNSAPSVEKVADTTLSYAVPALQIILGMLDPEALPIVNPIIAEAQKDLTVASGLIYDFGPSPQAANVIQTVENNLNGMLAAGHIKNPALVAKVTAVTNTIGSLATALLNSIGKPAPTK